MPATFDQLKDPAKKAKALRTAFDSFDADGTIHVDGLVGSATISPSGRDVALASPEGLAIIDLDSPYSPPRRLSSHGLPWLVVDVQWSPFAARDYWVASTANHRCLIWNLNLRDDSSSGAVEHSLQGHSRAITDINFSAHHPDFLATCAVDGYVHTWDLRRPRRPALTFCDWFAGATQIRYNRQDPHLLASSHDRWLHIWDDRKSSEPLKSITAHTSKIYGIDWNRTRSTGIVTCSLDKSIKFWDYRNEDDVPERVIRTDFPVWRARHTPFGWGLLAMPQTAPGELYLFDRRPHPDVPVDGKVDPVAVFPGHGNHKVKEFLWRTRGGIGDDGIDNREFQLVSWGEDNELRLSRTEPHILSSVGYEKGKPARKNIPQTRKGATYKTFRTVDDGGHRDNRGATMSDPRPGSGGSHYRQSASTLRTKMPHYYAGSTWRGASMKARAAPTRDVDQSQLQMNWMKGITMTKRKTISGHPQRQDSKDASMFGPHYHGAWGEPDTFQEEFVRISSQLPNVKWDEIDMDSLILNASLRGPWGLNGELIFLKVKVDVPHAYPKAKAPRFIIEKNAFMSDETHRKLEREVHQIANQFLKRQKNCLDATFSYLLGEADLETSTTFFKNVRDLDDDIDGLADESSSEDEESDIPAGGSASMSQELLGSAEINTTLAPTHRVNNLPLIRTCGARFSNDGRLVCFFPTKDAKMAQLNPPDSLRERPKDLPNFAGFGRLTRGSPPPRQRYMNDDGSMTDDHSDDSEDSDGSSSDSELESMNKISMWYQPSRRFRKTWSAHDSLRSSGGGTGTGTGIGTGTGTGTSRRRPGRPKNIISLYDMQSELPSKQQFADEYAIFGDGADVCEHNAQVAERYGYYDLVDIWRYSALLLRSDIPLELHELRQRNKSILVIAKDALARQNSKRSEVDALKGRVKWGYHPLARDFVDDLFEYFDRLADVQMLAMLSCIFGESSTEDGVAYAESRLPLPETPLPMKAPSFSLEYFPTDTTVWNIHSRSQASSAITTPRTVHTPVLFSDSQGSEDAVWPGEPGSQSYSTGETPPQRFLKDHLGDIDLVPSLSTSPDNRGFRRSNSAITSAFVPSLPRTLTSFATNVSSSPPSRKRPSPAETILSNFAPSNITWGGSTVFGGAPAEPTGTARTSVSDDEYRRDELISMVPVGVSVAVENEMMFDDDGWLSKSLLDPNRNALFASYRYAYAEMLQMWGQPLARLEIMKFNILKEDASSPSMNYGVVNGSQRSLHDVHAITESGHTVAGVASPINLLGGKREQLQTLLTSGRGLDVTGVCRVHETQLNPLQYAKAGLTAIGGAVGTCDRCKRTQTQLWCVYCHEPIDALYPPCLNCGCVIHEHCLAEWHAAGETECPAGDECDCVHEADNGQVESWTAMKAALASEQQHHQQQSPQHHTRRATEAVRVQGRPATGLDKMVGRTGRLRTRTIPSGPHLRRFVDEDIGEGGEGTPTGRSSLDLVGRPAGDGDGDDDEQQIERDDWESVASVPSGSASAAQGKPSPLGPGAGAVSAARLSLGSRLKKSLAEGGRPGTVRRKSVVLPGKKTGA